MLSHEKENATIFGHAPHHKLDNRNLGHREGIEGSRRRALPSPFGSEGIDAQIADGKQSILDSGSQLGPGDKPHRRSPKAGQARMIRGFVYPRAVPPKFEAIFGLSSK
jgi:hypothetical protein